MVLMNLFAGQPWRLRHKVQTSGHSPEKERGMDGESSMETCIPDVN